MQELTLKELQQVSLEILTDIHNFCVSNHINYSIAYGSLIGAIRHKGFIPWDDDVDIVMPRPDYERFCNTYTSTKFDLIYYGNDKPALAGFARIVDCKKTVFKAERPWTKKDSGVWIDLFPIDGAEDDILKYAKRYHRMKKICSIAYKFRRQNHNISHKDSILSIAKTIIARAISLNGYIPSLMIKHLVELEKKVDFNNSKYFGQCSCLDDGPIQFCKDDFNSYVKVKFENTHFFAMTGYENHLKQLYGDFMKLPPIEQRKPKQYWIKFYWRN